MMERAVPPPEHILFPWSLEYTLARKLLFFCRQLWNLIHIAFILAYFFPHNAYYYMKLHSVFVHVYCLSYSKEGKIETGNKFFLFLVVTIAPDTLSDT